MRFRRRPVDRLADARLRFRVLGTDAVLFDVSFRLLDHLAHYGDRQRDGWVRIEPFGIELMDGVVIEVKPQPRW